VPSGPNVPVIAARTPQGLEAVMELDGAVNAAAFAVYLDQVLGPTLGPADVVVRDKLRVHKAPRLGRIGGKAWHPPLVLAALLARLYTGGTGL
jgi:hypothetical protein